MSFRLLLFLWCAPVWLAVAAAAAEPTTVRLRADHWMPYNGKGTDERPGYVVEMARLIYGSKGITVSYETMPWAETLQAAREGRISGAIGTNAAEAEGLVLPQEPVGNPTVLIVTRRDSTWVYESPTSFRTIKLGVIAGYSYWPGLDTYIEKNAGKGVVVADSATPLDDLVKQLDAGEIDALVETETVLLWHLRKLGRERADLRAVYRHQSEPIFIGFAPTDEGRRCAALFDEGVRALRSTGELERLLKRYGLYDWQ